MRCVECGHRFEQGERICVDDEDTLCMSCLEDRIWMCHGTEEIAQALGYEIQKYKSIEKPVQPAQIQILPGQVCMF